MRCFLVRTPHNGLGWRGDDSHHWKWRAEKSIAGRFYDIVFNNTGMKPLGVLVWDESEILKKHILSGTRLHYNIVVILCDDTDGDVRMDVRHPDGRWFDLVEMEANDDGKFCVPYKGIFEVDGDSYIPYTTVMDKIVASEDALY